MRVFRSLWQVELRCLTLFSGEEKAGPSQLWGGGGVSGMMVRMDSEFLGAPGSWCRKWGQQETRSEGSREAWTGLGSSKVSSGSQQTVGMK